MKCTCAGMRADAIKPCTMTCAHFCEEPSLPAASYLLGVKESKNLFLYSREENSSPALYIKRRESLQY